PTVIHAPPFVIASAAKQSRAYCTAALDCFAALAMTIQRERRERESRGGQRRPATAPSTPAGASPRRRPCLRPCPPSRRAGGTAGVPGECLRRAAVAARR